MNRLFLPFIKSKYLVSNTIIILYNNVFNLWKKYKLNKYILYLIKEYYFNPRYPYINHFIENNLYQDNIGNLKIGYINNKSKLIWFRLK